MKQRNKKLNIFSSLIGFSLVELLVVVAIIGILAAIGTINYLKYVENANIAVVSSNLSSVASALKSDIASINAEINPTSSLLDGVNVNTCEDIAIATVNFINKKSNFKNPYRKNEANVTAAYGNYMTATLGDKIAQVSPLIKGSIIVSCSDPTARPTDIAFLIYECSCDTDNCAFDSFIDPATENCRIPSPSPTFAIGADPYSP